MNLDLHQLYSVAILQQSGSHYHLKNLFHWQTKHVKVDSHHIREKVIKKKILDVRQVSSANQLEILVMKPLGRLRV